MDLDHDACYRAVTLRDARFDGRFFTAVKTTGIYCRPVCPARTPRSENVTFYLTAASAQEAGFRPCLRCRPETAPDLGAWRGTSNTVSRALRLIELGALDDGRVEALAERLGVGERQLRRLFREHLGATPIAVAQTRRVLLAKQLLHETRLPLTEVALAAGFGSVRRFNETFQDLFGRPPTALRRARPSKLKSSAKDARPSLSGIALADARAARRDGESGANAQADLILSLRYQSPYEWPCMLEFLRQRAIAGVELITDGGYSRTLSMDGVEGTLEVRPSSFVANALRVRLRMTRLSLIPAIIARLRRVFDLAADPRSISAHLAEDPTLAPLVAMRPGLRVPGAWDGFELAVRAVLGQQISVAAAVRLAARLVAVYGTPLRTPEPGLTHAFPTPERLAPADLTALGLPKSRAAALSALAVAVLDDPGLLAAHSELDQAVRRLRSIPGVGEWTAQYIALRQLRETDAFPASDLGLQRALADAQGRRPSTTEVLQMAERWRPWRAYAAQHLSSGVAVVGGFTPAPLK